MIVSSPLPYPSRRLCRPAVIVVIALILIPTRVEAGPEIPGATQTKPIALVGGTIHPVSGPAIEHGTLVFADGKITAVGADVAIPDDAERVDVAGKHVYPGLFDAHTHQGLAEISAVRATIDDAETGRINPNVKAWTSINADSDLIPVTRAGGVLNVLVAPTGGLISGRAAVVQLDGWNWTDMTVREDVAQCIRWPRLAPVHAWWMNEDSESFTDRDKSLAEIRQATEDARAYWIAKKGAKERGTDPPDHDLRWEAMIPMFERTQPVIVDADEIQQIQSAVAWAAEADVRLIIAGGYDAPRCAELLKKYDVPVIVLGVNRLPQRRSDPYDAGYTVADRLRKAGVRYCISGNERDGNVRNLPYHAAMAVAHGLPADEALRAITLAPAEILGVAEQVGSLDVGKDATLIVTTGDPLEMPTHVTEAFIQGRPVDLSNRQQRLWDKYRVRYERQSEPAKD